MIVIHNKIRKNKVINSLITNNNHFIHNKIKINHFIQTNQMINHNFLNSQNNRIIKKYKMKNKKNNHFIQIKLNQNNNKNNSNNQNNRNNKNQLVLYYNIKEKKMKLMIEEKEI